MHGERKLSVEAMLVVKCARTLARPRLIAMLSFGSMASLSLIQLSFISGNAASPFGPTAFIRLPRASETRCDASLHVDTSHLEERSLHFQNSQITQNCPA